MPAALSIAFIRFRQGRFDEAIGGYSAVLVRDPGDANARFMRGVSKLRAGDQAGGAADVAAANTADPRVAKAYAAIGVRP